MLAAVLVLFLCCLNPAAAGQLLVIPMEGSRWLCMKEALAELSQRGHEIVVIAPGSKMLIDFLSICELKMYPGAVEKGRACNNFYTHVAETVLARNLS